MNESERKKESIRLRKKLLRKMDEEDLDQADVSAEAGISQPTLSNLLQREAYHRLTFHQKIKVKDYLDA